MYVLRKKRPSVAVEYRPEDTKEEVIGGTLIADDNRQPSGSQCTLVVDAITFLH